MAEQTFRSPGFFEREVDLTQRSQEIEGVPAGIIGTAQRGPAFVPVTVGSFVDFERKFGTLDPEKFGPYAVDAFLQHRTAATYIRVLGAGANSTVSDINVTQIKGTVKNAGFVVSGSGAAASGLGHDEPRRNGGVQFIAAAHEVPTEWESVGYPIFTDNDTFNISAGGTVQLIRGMVMMASGARLEVMNFDETYSGTTADDSAKINSYDGTESEGTFKLVISSSNTDGSGNTLFGNDEGFAGVRIYTASLDPTNKNYIGKILNTSPDRFFEEQHLLYADFPIEKEIAKTLYDNTNSTVAILSGTNGTVPTSGDSNLSLGEAFGRFDTRYQTARTTEFISQPFGNIEYDLFHFESLDDGEAGNTRVKVSISNLRRSSDPKNPYGTFTVLIRDFYDSDTNMKVLEQFSQCTLNPADENYVATKIGDMKLYYNFDAETESERRVNVSGKRPNLSEYVRIVMNANVEDKKIPKETLPFGFRGLPALRTSSTLSDDNTIIGEGNNSVMRLHHKPHASEASDLDYSVVPPVPFRFKQTRGAVNSSPSLTGQAGSLELADSRYFWGVKFERVPLTASLGSSVLYSNASDTPNGLIESYSKFLGISKLDVLVTGSAVDAFNNNKFTLARVAINPQRDATHDLPTAIKTEITGTAAEHIREAAYIRNSVLTSPNMTVNDGGVSRLTFASLVTNKIDKTDTSPQMRAVPTFNKFTDYLKFTNFFYGGFDGLNIFDRDQRLMNDKAASVDTGGKAASAAAGSVNLLNSTAAGSGVENNIISSYRTAGRVVTDELSSRANIIAVPGIRGSFVTDYIADLTRDYSKAIYLMDVPAYNDDNVILYDDATTRPNVRKSVEQFEGRAIDNNYVAAYFPDVIKNDPVNNEAVNMPASIAAIGAIAYNDSVAYPWFAPAGFNRAALGDVINTEIRLNTEDRDILYEARINPIANFPNGGFVIFGQKTLQQNKSALDRVNVRRMLLEVKRLVSEVGNRIIFEQNTPATRARFVSQVTPLLATIQSQQGIDQFKVVMDSSNNTQNDVENNKLNGTIILVPTRAVEFIQMDFIITNSGVSFE